MSAEEEFTDRARASPVSKGSAEVINRGSPARRTVALTFDAGADAGNTQQILATLRRYRVHASFGITGRWATQNPELVARVAAGGHHVFNHSFDHRSFTGAATRTPPLSRGERFEQLDKTDAVLRRLTGATTKPWFRAPYMDNDDSVNADIFDRGYLYNAGCTVDSLGWKGDTSTEIVQRCIAHVCPGAIYLLHVGSRSEDGHALQAVIEGLSKLGYGFRTLPELLA